MTGTRSIDATAILPEDSENALLVGRVWSEREGGPVLVAVRGDAVFDLSRVAATARDLFEHDAPVAAIRAAGELPRIASLVDVLRAASEHDRDPRRHDAGGATGRRRGAARDAHQSPHRLDARAPR